MVCPRKKVCILFFNNSVDFGTDFWRNLFWSYNNILNFQISTVFQSQWIPLHHGHIRAAGSINSHTAVKNIATSEKFLLTWVVHQTWLSLQNEKRWRLQTINVQYLSHSGQVQVPGCLQRQEWPSTGNVFLVSVEYQTTIAMSHTETVRHIGTIPYRVLSEATDSTINNTVENIIHLWQTPKSDAFWISDKGRAVPVFRIQIHFKHNDTLANGSSSTITKTAWSDQYFWHNKFLIVDSSTTFNFQTLWLQGHLQITNICKNKSQWVLS